MWRTTRLLVLFGDSMSVAKSGIGMLCFILSPSTEFPITAGLVYWYHTMSVAKVGIGNLACSYLVSFLVWILLHCLRLMITSTMCRSYIYEHM
ncbi:hypothetical protein PILCRDRAFT_525804 [Piloderma croceum F 1598]|uniref:Uncharacterized protein n=1 Tax=Piloderma croceum (strain F 1598) TaxID=765440 RepID=A0A0C3BT66_PILCF|nr:hypothetical protein PILCRDRAFT_525804 [Piloderma croceum F 1598]